MTELPPAENTAMETDERDPFRLPSGPSKGRKRLFPALSNARSSLARHHRPISLQVGDDDPHRIVNNQIGGDLIEK